MASYGIDKGIKHIDKNTPTSVTRATKHFPIVSQHDNNTGISVIQRKLRSHVTKFTVSHIKTRLKRTNYLSLKVSLEIYSILSHSLPILGM